MVSVAHSSDILYVGQVPEECRPPEAYRPDNEGDLLWALKGAGTNIGIVVSVTFKAYAAQNHLVRNWVVPLENKHDARRKISAFEDIVTKQFQKNATGDLFLYSETGQVQLGATMFESSFLKDPVIGTPLIETCLGPSKSARYVNDIKLFDTDMYVSMMHGGHGGGKTSSFKRCLFFRDISKEFIVDRLLAALKSSPSGMCYFHLLQGGGAIQDVAASDTAFGCRDWNFACVITGVWPRDQDVHFKAHAVVQWVYEVVSDLLPLSSGSYAADLGPDPRDTALAQRAFGNNFRRLTHLKGIFDLDRVLEYTCPLPWATPALRLIVLVTGPSGVGKDYCANEWTSSFNENRIRARVASISDSTEQDYVAAHGADLSRLLTDRAYKEEHREALTLFYHKQVKEDPQLPERHFIDLIARAGGVDILFITGMRDNAPVTFFSHLAPSSKIVEVNVQALARTNQHRRGITGLLAETNKINSSTQDGSGPHASTSCLVFNNNEADTKTIRAFAKTQLAQYVHNDVQQLKDMVRQVAHFPRQNVDFHHVLGIAQLPGGLELATSLLRRRFNQADWTNVDAIVSCETGGIVFASPLALVSQVPLVLIREAGKLPPPTLSVSKRASYISSNADKTKEKCIEMEVAAITKGSSVVVIDDVLSTGETLFAMLQLLEKAGINDVSVVVVAEFPVHRGRYLLHQQGFGAVKVESLLVFGAA